MSVDEEYTTLDWRIDKVCDAYVCGNIVSIEELEAALDHVLAGGFINAIDGTPAE